MMNDMTRQGIVSRRTCPWATDMYERFGDGDLMNLIGVLFSLFSVKSIFNMFFNVVLYKDAVLHAAIPRFVIYPSGQSGRLT